ncbi:Dehydration-responsive element-binding protein 1B [Acorus gramineus]|uniref:Dehydration-responsive element-binding protein 1B n=1 Tax=Acorus gramineus TaxID=55184 RepID=A0AAV9AB45_ACOGR|nr:Dehydration-responsive element-binding protein 1B [Acorus gramineus]
MERSLSSDCSQDSNNNHLPNQSCYATVSTSRPKRRAGRTKFRETRHPVYKGVRRRNSDKWVCEVREPNKKTRIWLGTFPTAEMAARAHDVAAMALRGRSACLNFADSAWLLPIPCSANAKDIQKAAAEAAEAFRPQPEIPAAEVAAENKEGAEAAAVMDDEVDFFGMPGLLEEMMRWSAPQTPIESASFGEGGGEFDWDDLGSDGDVSLWSYSI